MTGIVQVEEYIQKLRDFFMAHPVWVRAAKPVRDGANSEVFFEGVSNPYHLMRQDGKSYLREGRAPSPDFSFLFTAASIDELTSIDGDRVADFAITLFDLINDDDPQRRVRLRVVGSVGQILRRGYLQVILKGGPQVLQFASTHGVRNLADFGRVLKRLRGNDVDWNMLREEQS